MAEDEYKLTKGKILIFLGILIFIFSFLQLGFLLSAQICSFFAYPPYYMYIVIMITGIALAVNGRRMNNNPDYRFNESEFND
ncbi:MAG: hypothetical protein ABSF36_07120 [Candidatus Methanomethylicaceae archaeon]|jgi:hypothetical protein